MNSTSKTESVGSATVGSGVQNCVIAAPSQPFMPTAKLRVTSARAVPAVRKMMERASAKAHLRSRVAVMSFSQARTIRVFVVPLRSGANAANVSRERVFRRAAVGQAWRDLLFVDVEDRRAHIINVCVGTDPSQCQDVLAGQESVGGHCEHEACARFGGLWLQCLLAEGCCRNGGPRCAASPLRLG